MDLQLRRALLEVSVLTVLRRRDSYGYQIIKDVSRYIEISESTLYPILRRLEADQMLECYSVTHQGRLRKYYRITAKGGRRVVEFAADMGEAQKVLDFIIGDKQNDGTRIS